MAWDSAFIAAGARHEGIRETLRPALAAGKCGRGGGTGHNARLRAADRGALAVSARRAGWRRLVPPPGLRGQALRSCQRG